MRNLLEAPNLPLSAFQEQIESSVRLTGTKNRAASQRRYYLSHKNQRQLESLQSSLRSELGDCIPDSNSDEQEPSALPRRRLFPPSVSPEAFAVVPTMSTVPTERPDPNEISRFEHNINLNQPELNPYGLVVTRNPKFDYNDQEIVDKLKIQFLLLDPRDYAFMYNHPPTLIDRITYSLLVAKIRHPLFILAPTDVTVFHGTDPEHVMAKDHAAAMMRAKNGKLYHTFVFKIPKKCLTAPFSTDPEKVFMSYGEANLDFGERTTDDMGNDVPLLRQRAWAEFHLQISKPVSSKLPSRVDPQMEAMINRFGDLHSG